MSIKHWPSHIQPREKLLAHGTASLSDAELLAIFIQTGGHGKSAVEKAYQLLSEFGDIKSLLDQPYTAIKKIPGIGKAKFSLLQASLEISQRYTEQACSNLPPLSLTSSHAVKQFLKLYFRQRQQEIVACLFLNQHHQLIAKEVLFQGSINHAPIFPRQIVTRALHHKAPAIILAHNHPSGKCLPSKFDIETTHELRIQLNYLDITLLDHCIVTDRQVYSLAEHGWN